MQEAPAFCQLETPARVHVGEKSTLETERMREYSAGGDQAAGAYGVSTPAARRGKWMPNAAETVAHTTSRHTGPRAWLRALGRSIKADLIEGATATTVVVYEDLARRMDYSTGHVRYCLAEVMERTGLSRTAITDHIRLLRRAGWLAWVEHGSLRNALRSLGLPGYARTATVYAATIPPEFDALEGNVLTGSGYDARVVTVTQEARARRVAQAGSRTPSLRVVKEEGQVQVVGGEGLSTAQARAAKTTPRRKKTLTILRYRITPERVERARQLAVTVRPLVNWIQRATHAQLSWVLLDLVAMGWSESRIVRWLNQLGAAVRAQRWRPRFPHRVIAAALRRDDIDPTLTWTTEALPPRAEPNTAFQQATQALHGREPVEEYPTVDEAPEDVQDLLHLREAAAKSPELVVAYARFAGREEALRVYGARAAHILDMAAAGLLAGAA